MSGIGEGALNFVGVPIAAYTAHNEKADLNNYFGKGDLKKAKENPVVRKKLKELDERWEGAVWESIFGWIGGIVLGGILCFLTPIPTIVGMIAGGIGGSYLYNSMCEKQAEDPLVINEQIIKMRTNGENVSPEVVFAALAANVSGKTGEEVDKTLKRYTGKELFSEVLGNPASVEKLTAMMNNPRIDSIIRAQTRMPMDQENQSKSVAVQYAELINSGRMDVRDLLIVGAGLDALSAPTQKNNASIQSPEAPTTPAREQQQIPTRSS